MDSIASRLDPTHLMMAYDVVEREHRKTPLVPFGISERQGVNVDVYVKMDSLNPGGSFKDRGSLYFVHREYARGNVKDGDPIVTASAGNHAKGVARAAKKFGLRAMIYMPRLTPETKVEGARDLGATVTLVDGSYNDAAVAAKDYAESSGHLYVPAYEHEHVIMGQSTVVSETMMQLWNRGKRPDFFIYPYGGGGLSNGGAFATKFFDSSGMFRVNGETTKIHNYGVQAKNFNTMVRSYHAGSIQEHIDSGETIADGIRVPVASQGMLELSLRNLDDMFDVTEAQIRESIRRTYNSSLVRDIQSMSPEMLSLMGFTDRQQTAIDKLNIIEGATGAAFAAAYAQDKIPFAKIAAAAVRENIVGVIVASGNNIDRTLLDEILAEGRD